MATVYGYPSSIRATFLFLFIFTLSFFPNTFISLVKAPLSIVFNPATSKSSSSISSISNSRFQPSSSSHYGDQPPKVSANNPQEQSSRLPPTTTMTCWFQKTLQLPAHSRGSYLITDTIVNQLPELREYRVGILHLFAQHTSCALSLNENWDEDVRADMSDALDRIVPEDRKGQGLYRHSAEGSDDMPAHVKTALIGPSVSIPITNGKLATGTWQGIWYLEFRAAKPSRKLVATIQGEKM